MEYTQKGVICTRIEYIFALASFLLACFEVEGGVEDVITDVVQERIFGDGGVIPMVGTL